MTNEAPKRFKRPVVLALYNRPQSSDTAFLTFGPECLKELESALGGYGYRVVSANLDDDVDRIGDAVVVHRPTVIFHLVDHLWGDNSLHAAVAGMLDLFGYVYTGSDPLALGSCQDRVRTHVMLRDADIPVPAYAVLRDVNAFPSTEGLRFPAIVTQAFDDIYDDSRYRTLLDDAVVAEIRAGELATQFELPLMIEEYLPGRRLQCIVIGNRVLEVLPIVERWVQDVEETEEHAEEHAEEHEDEEDSEGEETEWVYDVAHIDVEIADAARQLSRRAFRTMGCRDIAQIDLSLGDDGDLRILDVRPVVDVFAPPFRTAAESCELGMAGSLALLVRTAHRRLPTSELAIAPVPVFAGEAEAGTGETGASAPAPSQSSEPGASADDPGAGDDGSGTEPVG